MLAQRNLFSHRGHKERVRGFTLVELMVAMVVSSLLLVVLFSIIGEMVTTSRRAAQSLIAANSAATAMDVLAADLGGLMPLEGDNEYLFLASETSGGATTACLRLLAASPNNAAADAAPGQPCFVAYRVGQYDPKTLEVSGASAGAAFALFRSVTEAEETFSSMMDGASINDAGTQPTMSDFFANNVVEFSVQPMRGSTEVPARNSLSLKGNAPTGATRPDALLVTMVTLDDEGAQRLRDGIFTLAEAKTKHGRVLVRRIQLGDRALP